MIAIDKNIPLPVIERPQLVTRNSKYPWTKMEINDSFFVKDVKIKNFSGSAYAAGKRTGHKFAVRSMDGGVRVWRTA